MNLSHYTQACRAILSNSLKALPSILEGLLIYCVFLLAARLVRLFVSRITIEGKRGRKSIGLGIARLAEGAIIVLGLVLALVATIPSFKAAQVIELLGLGGVAFSFAFREILQNFFAGILILLTVPFEIDDQIVVGGIEGIVEDIQTRATFIRTPDRRRVVVPNATLITDVVTVNTAYDTRRLECSICISRTESIDRARAIILASLISAANPLLEPAPQVQITELTLNRIVTRVQWWISVSRLGEINESVDRALEAIAKGLEVNGIELAAPITKVIMQSAD